MSLKIKLFKTLLFSFSAPLLSIITTSCSLSIKIPKNDQTLGDSLLERGKDITPPNAQDNNQLDKGPYFINLLRLKQEEQGIKINNSIIFDQFSDSLYKINQYHFRFLKDGHALITSKEDFSKYITNKINSLYQIKELELPKTLSDLKIQKIFENDFLNGQSIDSILRQNNILILESSNDRSPIYLDYFLKDEKKDHINIQVIDPTKIDDYDSVYLRVIQTYIDSPKSVFSVIVVPKGKRIEFKRTTQNENIQLTSELSRQYHYKPQNFYNWFYEGSEVSQRIKKIQNKQGIFNKENFILKDLTNESVSELPLDSKVNIIKNSNEFNEFIINPIQKLDHSLAINEITNDFEVNYLNSQKLNEVLKTHDIVVQQLIQKPNKPSNRPTKLIKMPSSNSSQIDLAFIDDRELNFNFISSYDTWNDSLVQKPRIFYQGLLVPKGSQVKMHGKLNFKETNDFLLANKSLYQVKKSAEQ
ncbi:hypothetical protein NPA08_03125 [Mycoplasmopsis citelli]|uniref:Lipoprotein n=1 Tax=Mycoplasmopsis citelli TaxID=171281 RepID=A0A449B1L8_9BACT|nr:hypothetical protein [Mycoplasmopsis citelli]UUD35927.1 hypothetical protein NPA08_03125 [Mycoplasmopsis citelli]VEU74466.1 Uncharacterised protein [Mycoplasmopsis citelli]